MPGLLRCAILVYSFWGPVPLVTAKQPLKVLEDIHSGGLVMQISDFVFLLLYGKYYKAYMYILLVIQKKILLENANSAAHGTLFANRITAVQS